MESINISQDIFFYLALLCILYSRYIKIEKKSNISKEIIIILFQIYIIKVISLVFFPITFQFGSCIIIRLPIIWINPIDSWIHIIQSNNLYGIIYNILGNIMLLAPLPTFLIYFHICKFDNIRKIFFICLLTSLGIEVIQYIESILIAGVSRFFEINDILLNTLGGMIGYLLYNKYIKKLLNKQ